jgi:hypothetical protein
VDNNISTFEQTAIAYAAVLQRRTSRQTSCPGYFASDTNFEIFLAYICVHQENAEHSCSSLAHHSQPGLDRVYAPCRSSNKEGASYKMDNEDNVSTCSVCLEPTAQRGGKPLYSPACCGNWFHLECAYAMAKSVSCSNKCPYCRARITLPQAFNSQQPVTDITLRIRLSVEAVDSLLHPGVSLRVVTLPVSTPAGPSQPVPAPRRTLIPVPIPAMTASRASDPSPVPPRTFVPTPVPSRTSSVTPAPPRTLIPLRIPPTMSTPDPKPPSATLPVPAPARAPPPVPVPARVCSQPPVHGAADRSRSATTTQATAAAEGTHGFKTRSHDAPSLARFAAATTQSGGHDGGVRCGQPERVTRTDRYTAAVREPDSDCVEISVLTRDHKSDDFVDLDNLSDYELSANVTGAASVASTAATVTRTTSLGQTDPVLCARRSDYMRRPLRPPPLVRPPRLPTWLCTEPTAAHRATAGPPRSAEKAQEQVFGTTDTLAQPSLPSMHNRFQSYDNLEPTCCYARSAAVSSCCASTAIAVLAVQRQHCYVSQLQIIHGSRGLTLLRGLAKPTGRLDHVRRALRFDEREGWSYQP